MGHGPKKRLSLEEILASTSDTLFPAELGEKPVTIESTDCDGDTPLHVMVWRNDRYAVDALIEAGANIDAIGDMTQTPLHIAVGKEDLYIIEELLKAGAKTNIRSEFNETAYERALKKGGEIVKLFSQYSNT
ncbi:MAG: ankyrin repeat domain-containing protein [Neptuniibacter sp.]